VSGRLTAAEKSENALLCVLCCEEQFTAKDAELYAKFAARKNKIIRDNRRKSVVDQRLVISSNAERIARR
jgi:hypothetical protein